MAVAALVLENGGDEDQVITALLHDGPEDQGGVETLERISRIRLSLYLPFLCPGTWGASVRHLPQAASNETRGLELEASRLDSETAHGLPRTDSPVEAGARQSQAPWPCCSENQIPTPRTRTSARQLPTSGHSTTQNLAA